MIVLKTRGKFCHRISRMFIRSCMIYLDVSRVRMNKNCQGREFLKVFQFKISIQSMLISNQIQRRRRKKLRKLKNKRRGRQSMLGRKRVIDSMISLSSVNQTGLRWRKYTGWIKILNKNNSSLSWKANLIIKLSLKML